MGGCLSLTARPAAAVPARRALLGVKTIVDFLFLSPVMETSGFLNTDGVWFGKGAEEKQRSSPRSLPAAALGPAGVFLVAEASPHRGEEKETGQLGLREAVSWSTWDN